MHQGKYFPYENPQVEGAAIARAEAYTGWTKRADHKERATMGLDAWVTPGILGVVVILLASTRISPDLILMAALTGLLTNNAAAVLIFPIAMAGAAQLGVNPQPFVMSIMPAASASFATPIGYQTNLMVYGPGGYHFADYVRVGLPLNILLWVVTIAVAPIVWPF